MCDSESVKALGTDMILASWGIRFAASQKNDDYVLSGMNSMQQIENNISFMKSFKPLNKAEEGMLLQIASEYIEKKYIQCTECRYCVDVCLKNIDIPVYLKLLNDVKRTDNKSVFYNSVTYYDITFPDIPECIIQGDDMQQAYEMAVEAFRLAISSRVEDGQEIPAASEPYQLMLEANLFCVIIEFNLLAYKRTNSKAVK